MSITVYRKNRPFIALCWNIADMFVKIKFTEQVIVPESAVAYLEGFYNKLSILQQFVIISVL